MAGPMKQACRSPCDFQVRRSPLKPFRDDLLTWMDGDHVEQLFTRILERVGRVGRRKHDLAATHFSRGVPNGKGDSERLPSCLYRLVGENNDA